MMRRIPTVFVALLLAAAASVVPSAASAEPGVATLQVSGPVGATIGDTVELTATLIDSEGTPVADVQLLVEERLGFFDTKVGDVVVASAATNDDGVAVIRYVARRDGDRSLLIRFPGNKDFAEATADFSFGVEPGSATYTVEAPPGIPGVNRLVLIVLLVGIWGTMLVVAGHVAAIVRRGATAERREGEVAS